MSSTVNARSRQKQVILPALDISWMEPGKKIWVEQLLAQDSKDDTFLQCILTTFDLPSNHATYTSSSGQVSNTELKYINERAEDYTNKDNKGFEDMVNMEIINDAELLMNIAARYRNNLIFTYVGPTLLVVNPFQSIPLLFLPEIKSNYIGKIALQRDGHYKDLPPHIYAVGAEAYRCLFENQKNQAIVISGESGAGKTENAKYCMNLLTSIGSYSSDPLASKLVVQEVGIEDKILSCNPILESFGNAKTLRNNNSSRFGKYVRMMVDQKNKKIQGAQIINYLLEKSRITSQGKGERNFHIFYFLLAGLSPQQLEQFHLSQDGKKLAFEYFNYLRNESGLYVIEAINDKEMFDEIKESIQVLGFTLYFDSIFSIVSAVLLIGNLDFDESTFGNESTCEITDYQLLGRVAFLLNLEPQQVKDALTLRQRDIQKQIINSPLTREECLHTRDSWAKELYERLFSWIVEKLNDTIQPSKVEEFIYVGLLDIYGFEVFLINGFNQLMINYSNEKLHQLYIFYVFKEEEQVFIDENLQQWCCQIKFTDNQQVMDLMDKYPTGIFDLLDESCQIKSDDDQLLQKIRKGHLKNPLLLNPKMISKPTFIVVHTAKEVEYSIVGFRERNKDELPNLTHKISSMSKNNLIAKLFELTNTEQKKDKSLSKKVRSQMQELMKELSKCDVHFVRCIKPNDEKMKLKIVQAYTLTQIRYLGVLDSLKIRKQNYPIRRPYHLFYRKYGDMTKNKTYPQLTKDNADFKVLCHKMFEEFMPELGPELVLFGKRRIFIRQEAMMTIDKIYALFVKNKNDMAKRIQRTWRAKQMLKKLHKFSLMLKNIKTKMKLFRSLIYYKVRVDKCVKIQKWFKKVTAMHKIKLYLKNVLMIQNAVKRYVALKLSINLKLQVVKLQRFTRMVVKMNVKMKTRFIKNHVLKAIENAWLVIQNKRAITIQRFMRGYLIRKKCKKQIDQIHEAGRNCKIRRVATCIQRFARGYIVRQKIKRMHIAAYHIQGYLRMTWLSELFQTMRSKAKVIQYHIRLFQLKTGAMRAKYSKYILPMEERFQQQKAKEESILFGGNCQEADQVSKLQDRLQSDYFSSQISPFMHNNIPIRNTTKTNIFKSNDSESSNKIRLEKKISSYDDIIDNEQDPSNINPKIKLFAFLIDLEVLADISEYYVDSYSDNFKRLFEQNYQIQNYLQTLHVGATHSFATSSSGKIYAWGMNDFGQLGLDIPSLNPIKPTVIQLGFRIKQIATGADHTLILSEEGRLLICGSNEQGQQLRTNMYQSQLKDLDLPFICKQVTATNHTSFALSEEGRVYSWPVGNKLDILNSTNSMPMEMTLPFSGQQIIYIATGNEFAVLLSSSGQLFSFGENHKGELGLGDNDTRTSPCLVNFSKSQKVFQVQCGFKHCVAKTTLGKIYVWGWGEFGQLGTDKFQDINYPFPMDIPDQRINLVNQVQASHRSTMILVDNSKIFWCGTNATISYQSSLCLLQLQTKCQVLANNEYSPIRILSSYSRTLSLIYVTYANHREMFSNHPGAARGVLSTLTQKWIEQQQLSVDPPIIESISKHMSEQHQKLPVKSKNNAKKDLSIIQLTDYHSNSSRNELSPKYKPRSPRNIFTQNSDSSRDELQFAQIKPIAVQQIFTHQSSLQSQSFQQQLSTQRQQSPLNKKQSLEKIKNYEQPMIQQTVFQQQDFSQDDGEQFDQSPINKPEYKKSTKYSKITKTSNNNQDYNHDRLLKSLKSGPQQKSQPIQKKNNEISLKHKKQQNISSNSEFTLQDNKYQVTQNSEDQSDTENKIKKLRDIKQRLLALKITPESKWSAQDHEFLRNIYKSNLSILLDQVGG